MNNQSVLKSNLMIVFSDLEKAITAYLNGGHTKGETEYIDAYLAASIHALIDYADKYLDVNDERIKACKYANNTLKHNGMLITHQKAEGGFSFPFSSPFCIEEIQVVWNYNSEVKTRHKDQQIAFAKHFAGKPILDTLKPILREIEEN